MPAEKTYKDIVYKEAHGSLTINDKVFHFQPTDPATKASVKVSWARVEKRQLSPPSAPKPMMKLLLVSGKQVVFEVETRERLETLRADVQQRMDNAVATASGALDVEAGGNDADEKSSRVWQDEPEDPVNNNKRQSRTTTTTTSTTTQEKRDTPRYCVYCCFTSLLCWLICCLVFLAIIGVIVYVVYFTEEGEEFLEDVGIKEPRNHSIPPDWGYEDRYGIRNVTYEFDDESLTLKYEVSDYILDDSVRYILYNDDRCRRGTGTLDITDTDEHMFLKLQYPTSGGPDLQNKGTGDRVFKVYIKLNPNIPDASYYSQAGLYAAQLNFCVGFSIIYNRVEYWEEEKEVNFVETAVQMDIDNEIFFGTVRNVGTHAVIRPLYYRRH